MKFSEAIHSQDADGQRRTAGIGQDMRIHLTGDTGEWARFTPEQAADFGRGMIRLAAQAIAAQRGITPSVLHFPGQCWCEETHDVAGSLARNLTRRPPADPAPDGAA